LGNITNFIDINRFVRPFAQLMVLVCFVLMPTLLMANDSQPRVWKVKIEGNETFDVIVLREVIANSSVMFSRRMMFWKRHGDILSETEVRRDVVRLERFYQRRGFPDVRITYEINDRRKDWRKDVVFKINEGRHIRVTEITYDFVGEGYSPEDIENHRLYTRAKNRNPLREGRRYELIKHGDAEGLILNSLKNFGHAFAKVGVEATIDTMAYEAHVRMIIDAGPVAYLGEITIEGNETVEPRIVRNESGLAEGQLYDQRRLTRAQQEIFGHHLFRFVTISLPDQPRDSIADLNIRVRENPLRSVRAQVGFGTEELGRIGASWVHRNPFGNAHSFSVASRFSYLEQRVNVDYTIPYVFNTNSSFIISPFGQRLNEQNFLLYRVGAANSFVYQYSQNLAGTISYEFTRNEETLKGIDITVADSTQFYNQSTIKISGYYNQSFLDRGEGWAIRPFFETSGFLGTGTLRYDRGSLDVRRYIDFSRTSQLALRVDTGILFSPETVRLPANVLYYLGGNSSVRGWSRWSLGPKRPSFNEENEFVGYVPLGGRLNLAFNTEYRQDLNFIYRGLGMAIFLDGGQIWQTYNDMDLAELQFGTGAGLRYRSPVGPIRLDIGYKINPNDGDLGIYNGVDKGGRFARWGLHFSIGQSF
jgi:outer membrane protein insertion porin family